MWCAGALCTLLGILLRIHRRVRLIVPVHSITRVHILCCTHTLSKQWTVKTHTHAPGPRVRIYDGYFIFRCALQTCVCVWCNSHMRCQLMNVNTPPVRYWLLPPTQRSYANPQTTQYLHTHTGWIIKMLHRNGVRTERKTHLPLSAYIILYK